MLIPQIGFACLGYSAQVGKHISFKGNLWASLNLREISWSLALKQMEGFWCVSPGAERRQVVFHFPWVSLCLCLQRNIWKWLKLEFAYDAQHRRIAKVVKEWEGDEVTGGFTNVVKDRRYVYDGWNMIAESSRGTEARWTDGAADCPVGVRARAERPNQLDHTTATGNGLEGSTVVRTQVWGVDLSGTMQGAGGVGGLLAVRHEGQTYVPLLDGNGNVMGLQGLGGAKDGQTVARYDYDAFGNQITNTAPELGEEVNPFGFSTKFTDEETGLVYYGYRYYAPEVGRWVSRDPIEERGGINLYGMCANDLIANVDILGHHKGIIDGLDIVIWTVRSPSSFFASVFGNDSIIDLTKGGKIQSECDTDLRIKVVADPPISDEEVSKTKVGSRVRNGPEVLAGADTINGRVYPTVIHNEIYMGNDPFNQPLDVKGLMLWYKFNNAKVEGVYTLDAVVQVAKGKWKKGGKIHVVIYGPNRKGEKIWTIEID